jgi:hypothetical protein
MSRFCAWSILCLLAVAMQSSPVATAANGDDPFELIPQALLEYEEARLSAGLAPLDAELERKIVRELVRHELRRHAAAARERGEGPLQALEALERTLERILDRVGSDAIEAGRRRIQSALAGSPQLACGRALLQAVEAAAAALGTCRRGSDSECAVATLLAVLAQQRAERICRS